MCRQLLFTVVFCLFFTTILSIRCYRGTDRECTLAPNMNDCGSGNTCQCVKYRFQCIQDDQVCTEEERLKGIKKWGYTILPASTCQLIQMPLSGFEDVTCCSKNACNRPEYGKCSWSQTRRRALRKLTNLLDF